MRTARRVRTAEWLRGSSHYDPDEQARNAMAMLWWDSEMVRGHQGEWFYAIAADIVESVAISPFNDEADRKAIP